MECVIGIAFEKFVILAVDGTACSSILKIKNNNDKMFPLTKFTLIGMSGEPGDLVSFAEFIRENMALQALNNGFEHNPVSVANFTRHQMASRLRQKVCMVNNMIAGFDPIKGKAYLYFLDYLASLVPVPYGGHGYGRFFCLSVLDRYYRPDMSVDEGIKLLHMCADEIRNRLIINLDKFIVKIVDADGIRRVDDI